MILVDTSVWIDHFRRRNETLSSRLEEGAVLVHPFVIGELALGVLAHWQHVVSELRKFPTAAIAGDDDVLAFIGRQSLGGTGIGLVDAHLLAAAKLTPGATLWTRDRRLSSVAARLGLSAAL